LEFIQLGNGVEKNAVHIESPGTKAVNYASML